MGGMREGFRERTWRRTVPQVGYTAGPIAQAYSQRTWSIFLLSSREPSVAIGMYCTP